MSFSPTAGHTVPEIHAVTAWHEALNSGDVERLVELSLPDVEVGGPRGTGHGTQLLREWVGRANIRLEPVRMFHETDTVVVEQEAEWRPTQSGEPNGVRTVASVFGERGAISRRRGGPAHGEPRRIARARGPVDHGES